MPLSEIHARLANTALLYFLAISLWGFFRFFRKQGVSPAYWGGLAIAEILMLLQAILGAVLWFSGERPDRWVHILYGVVSLLMIPGVYIYTRGRDDRRDMLAYAAAAIITVGLILRALYTAVPPV